jgi:hypothetical protein
MKYSLLKASYLAFWFLDAADDDTVVQADGTGTTVATFLTLCWMTKEYDRQV